MKWRPSAGDASLILIGIWLLVLAGCAVAQERGRRWQRDRWMHEIRTEPR